MLHQKVLEKHGIKVVLDKNQVYPDDPGRGTPAMVYRTEGSEKYSATLSCAQGEGELESSSGEMYQLTGLQSDWLWDINEEAWKYLYGG